MYIGSGNYVRTRLIALLSLYVILLAQPGLADQQACKPALEALQLYRQAELKASSVFMPAIKEPVTTYAKAVVEAEETHDEIVDILRSIEAKEVTEVARLRYEALDGDKRLEDEEARTEARKQAQLDHDKVVTDIRNKRELAWSEFTKAKERAEAIYHEAIAEPKAIRDKAMATARATFVKSLQDSWAGPRSDDPSKMEDILLEHARGCETTFTY